MIKEINKMWLAFGIVVVVTILMFGVGMALSLIEDEEGNYGVQLDGIWFNDLQKQRILTYDCVLGMKENPNEIGFYGTLLTIESSCDTEVGYNTLKNVMKVSYVSMVNQGRSMMGSEMPICIKGDDGVVYFIKIDSAGQIVKIVDDGRCV